MFWKKNEMTPWATTHKTLVQLSITRMQKRLPPKDDHDAHLLITRLRRSVLQFGAVRLTNLHCHLLESSPQEAVQGFSSAT